MTLTSSRRTIGLVVTILIAGLIAFVVLNRGAVSGPEADDRAGESAGVTGSSPDGVTQPEPLVSRMLSDLQGGRSAKSFDNPAAGAPVQAIAVASDVPAGKISIPKMELRTTFFEGVHDKVIDQGPGHWPGTPLPGQAGNSVLSGHRATHGAEFVDLDDLRPGDEIDVQVGGSKEPLTYVVSGTTIVPEAKYVPFVLRQPADPKTRQLTLFACDPVYDSTHRIVVRAEAAPASPVKAG